MPYRTLLPRSVSQKQVIPNCRSDRNVRTQLEQFLRTANKHLRRCRCFLGPWVIDGPVAWIKVARPNITRSTERRSHTTKDRRSHVCGVGKLKLTAEQSRDEQIPM